MSKKGSEKDAKNEKKYTWILVVFCQLQKVETYGGHLKRHCDSKVLHLTVSGPYRKMLRLAQLMFLSVIEPAALWLF